MVASVWRARTALASALALLALTFWSSPAWSASVMVFAPHPDDEALMASGIIKAAKSRGDTITVVVVTNGDFGGVSTGYEREGETVTAMANLGLAESEVVFLGYGDQSLQSLYSTPNDTDVITSSAGVSQTYGNRGLGSMEWHRYLYGVHASYTRKNLLGDLQALFTHFNPQDIYVTDFYDAHPDHSEEAAFVIKAILGLKRSSGYSPRLHAGLVHAPCDTCDSKALEWPVSFDPTHPFPKPEFLDHTPLDWTRIESVTVPIPMQDTNQSTNLKDQTLTLYNTQYNGWFDAFCHSNEFFWVKDFSANLSYLASVTASSESSGQPATAAIDGNIAGANPDLNYESDSTMEWVSNKQLAGAWIQLNWAAPVNANRVILYDRVQTTENITAGTLLFSDGTSISVGALNANGAPYEVDFAAKSVTWVRFRIDGAKGTATGLSELEVYGSTGPAALTAVNLSPSSVVGGVQAQGTVMLSGPAPDGGATLALSSSSSVASVPTSVAIAAGASSASFAINTAQVSTVSNATISATYSGVTRTASLAVMPAAIVSSLAVNPTDVAGGTSAQGVVSLNAAAPDGGLTVALASDSTAASLPASVTVPAGSSSASFTVTTATVAAYVTANLSASSGGVTKAAALTIAPPASADLARNASVSVSSEDVADEEQGIKAIDGIVDGYPNDATKEWATLGQLDGAWITLSWSSTLTLSQVVLHDRPNLDDNILAGTLTFSDGSTVSVGALPNDGTGLLISFPARAVTWVKLTVTNAVGFNIGLAEFEAYGATGPATLSALGVTPASVVGGAQAQGIVTLTGAAPSGGATVALSSSSSVASVPVSVTVPAGASSASFTVSTSAVSSTTTATISASYSGVTRTASLSVSAAATLATLSLNPSSVAGGSTSQGTVTLTAAAPSGGLAIALSSDSAAASVPASVTVPAGSSSASFTVTTTSVTTSTTANISASAGGATQHAALAINAVSANVALHATVAVSSEDVDYDQLGVKAIDGVVDGYPNDYTKEWATVGQLAGAWITLTWSTPQTLSKVVLHDRPNLDDNIQAGTLTFSDGTTVSFGQLPDDGSGLTVTFPARSVTWVKLTVTKAVGYNIGLAEFEAYAN